MKKRQLSDKNLGLSPLQKCQFCIFFLNPCLYCLEGLFSNENVTKYFFWVCFALNETLTKFQLFDQKHGLTPLEKMPILWVFETDVFVVRKDLSAI